MARTRSSSDRAASRAMLAPSPCALDKPQRITRLARDCPRWLEMARDGSRWPEMSPCAFCTDSHRTTSRACAAAWCSCSEITRD